MDPMYVVAITRADGELKALAEAMGVTPYDARGHVQAGAPRVIYIRAEKADAQALADKVTAAGFAAIVVGTEDTLSNAHRQIPRSFEFHDDAFAIYLRDGQGFGLAYGDIRALIRGTRIVVATQVEHEVIKKKSAALRMATGGLVKHRKEVIKKTTTSDERQGFIEVIPRSGASVLLLERELVYDGMGSLKSPTRMANFNALFGLLKERSPGAQVDDRLVARGNQVRILGPQLSPEEDVDLAVTLVARVILA
jgi:hypothetical protein